MVKRAAWLSITPEPERVLPGAVATLRHGSRAPDDLVAAERARIEWLLLSGSERRWLAYLHAVVELIDRGAVADDAAVRDAAQLAASVLANHHNLLLGLPGRAAAKTASDRARLAFAIHPHEDPHEHNRRPDHDLA